MIGVERSVALSCSVQASARAPSPSSRDSLPYYQANRLTWLDDGGTFTDSSEDEDEPPLQHAPPRRYPPSLYRNRFDVNHLEAAWDLLHRPRGVSVRAFTRAFRHLHDEPQNDLLELMQLDDRFVFFWPTPRQQSAFVRRLWPHSMPSSFPAMASSRPRLAMASFSEAGVQRERGARYASFAHVAAGVVPPAPASIAPPPFAPRRLGRRSDAEILMTCFPVTNVPRDRPEEHEPPARFSRASCLRCARGHHSQRPAADSSLLSSDTSHGVSG